MRMKILLIKALFCFAFTSFAQNIITEIPSSGLVINSPGNYVFGENIKWEATGDGQAILITANNVILDLNNHSLKSKKTNFNTIGILAISVSNIIIKNGSIENFAFHGIKCENSANIYIKNITVNGLNKDNIATFTVPVGILVSTSSNAFVSQCTVKNLDVRTASLAAIQMTSTSPSVISDCCVLDLINRDGACSGIGHLACDNAKVLSCTVDNLRSEFDINLNTQGHTTIGLIPTLSTNLVIENCKISNIAGSCDDAHGISLFECLGAIVQNCSVTNVSDGESKEKTGAKATGIEVYASLVKVIDCHVKNIIAINPQDKQATGFSCAQCTGVNFIGCRAENVNVFDENHEHYPELGYGTGFGWAPDPRPPFLAPARNILYWDCTAACCQVGFDSWYHIDSVWRSINSDCNEIPILNQPNSQRTISCDPCSECNPPQIVTITNVAANNIFIDVDINNNDC